MDSKSLTDPKDFKRVVPDEGGIETLTKLDKVANVQLVITTTTGEIQGSIGFGENPLLAKALRMASELLPTLKFPVRKTEVLFPLGQDFYVAERDYVLALRGLFFAQRWDESANLEKTLPSSAIYTFVVSY